MCVCVFIDSMIPQGWGGRSFSLALAFNELIICEIMTLLMGFVCLTVALLSPPLLSPPLSSLPFTCYYFIIYISISPFVRVCVCAVYQLNQLVWGEEEEEGEGW